MGIRQTLILGKDRFRVGPWHADAAIAYLSLGPDLPRPSPMGLDQCLDRIASQGYSSVITAALHLDEAATFLQAGFVEYDRLRVLSHPLQGLAELPVPGSSGIRLRRARAADRTTALEVDSVAFPPFWRLDGVGLQEAIDATPRTRFRVAESEGVVIGYAVTGRTGRQGFIQRLATHPAHAGRGVGSRLIADALQWASRRRAERVLVNTQDRNERALELYRRLGFTLTATDLVVLTRSIP